MADSSKFSKPIIGVLNATTSTKSRGTVKLAKVNKEAQTTLYFFTRDDVSFSRKEVKGMYYSYEKKRWRTKTFPLPDVVYVRGATGYNTNQFLKRFDKLGIPRINPITTFNKAELYKILRKDDDIAPHLPYTKIIDDFNDVQKYIHKLGAIYVKACYGRRGTKVMRIRRSGGGYKYSYSVLGDMVSRTVRNFSVLKKVMRSFFEDHEVLVQQAIHLIRVDDNCRVDLRAEVQRNGEGEIEIIAIPIRVGQSGSPITTHGSAYPFDEYFEKLLPRYTKNERNKLKQKIDDFLVSVYECVENYYGSFGEIGIDFAVDKHGELWLIECNAQSAKVSIARAYDSDTIEQVYLNPLEYAKTLVNNSGRD